MLIRPNEDKRYWKFFPWIFSLSLSLKHYFSKQPHPDSALRQILSFLLTPKKLRFRMLTKFCKVLWFKRGRDKIWVKVYLPPNSAHQTTTFNFSQLCTVPTFLHWNLDLDKWTWVWKLIIVLHRMLPKFTQSTVACTQKSISACWM